MNRIRRRVAAVGAIAALAGAVVTDLVVPSTDGWWNRHSLFGSLVSDVLILALTILVLDEVAARRQVRERKRVAAVQAIIVYGQALRAEAVLMKPPDDRVNDDAVGEVRSLASMVLTAAPALFDDPEAREFMERVEGFSSMLIRVGLGLPGREVTDDDRAKLADAKQALTVAVEPIRSRLSQQDVTALEGHDAPGVPPDAGTPGSAIPWTGYG